MKKQTLLLIAGGMIALASCSSNSNQNASQAQIDSMVNVKTGEMQATMQSRNDSTINALAKAKADSITAAQASARAGEHRERREERHSQGASASSDQNAAPAPAPVQNGNTGKRGSQNQQPMSNGQSTSSPGQNTGKR